MLRLRNRLCRIGGRVGGGALSKSEVPESTKAGFTVYTGNALPSLPGVYSSLSFLGLFDTAMGIEGIGSANSHLNDQPTPTGVMNLTITGVLVPESASFSFVVISLLLLLLIRQIGHIHRLGCVLERSLCATTKLRRRARAV